jgi:hypothetical protein
VIPFWSFKFPANDIPLFWWFFHPGNVPFGFLLMVESLMNIMQTKELLTIAEVLGLQDVELSSKMSGVGLVPVGGGGCGERVWVGGYSANTVYTSM